MKCLNSRIANWILLPSTMKLWQGNVFTPVCHFVHRGSGRHPLGANTPPPEQTSPWEQTAPEQTPPLGADTPPLGADTRQEQTPPGSRHPPRSRSPRAETPPHSACWEIWATIGQYASYWNAYLLLLFWCMWRCYINLERDIFKINMTYWWLILKFVLHNKRTRYVSLICGLYPEKVQKRSHLSKWSRASAC